MKRESTSICEYVEYEYIENCKIVESVYHALTSRSTRFLHEMAGNNLNNLHEPKILLFHCLVFQTQQVFRGSFHVPYLDRVLVSIQPFRQII